MAFDAELPLVTTTSGFPIAAAFEMAADPAPQMVDADAQQLLAFLYVSPRPCAALDALLGL